MPSLLLKRIKDWATSITAFRTGDVIPVDGPSGTAKMSKDTLLELTAQNALAGNVAQEFDPTKPNDAGGYAYYKDEIVAYNGATYKFKVNHPSGAWNAAEVERYDASKSLKFFFVTDNPEYLYAVTDINNIFLFGVKTDGTFDFPKGVPQQFIERFGGKVDKVAGFSLIDSVFADAQSHMSNPEYVKIILDALGRVVEGINHAGQHVFLTKPKFDAGVDWSKDNLSELSQALKAAGFTGGTGDWSDAKSLEIPTPRCAVINISGIFDLPTTKTQDLDAVMEFWDLQGNYFKKSISALNAQGNSSLVYPKKNFSFDFDDFKLKIGSWVMQDSFHIKAFYTDYFRGVGEVGYTLYKAILDTRKENKNRSWKLGLVASDDNIGVGLGVGVTTDNSLRIDDGALCFPEGFPCVLFLNGEFYGVYAFQLKKHRDNYMMKKNNAAHIHLDGTGFTLFTGTIDWTAFEVRNPKGLKDVDGNDYDGDNPKELANTGISGQVKSAIVALSQVYASVTAAATTDAKKAIIESVFDIDNIIDYLIFCDITNNIDAFGGNWQWTTWDGVHWYVNAYDLDGVFGASFRGETIRLPATSHLGQGNGNPTKYVVQYYSDRLQARYAELRKSVLTQKNIVGMVDSWLKRIGLDNLKKDLDKWSDSPCNRNLVVNSDYWDLKVDGSGNPVIAYNSTGEYNSAITYSQGAEVVWNPADGTTPGWWYTFIAKGTTTGNAPTTKGGFRDSLWRLNNWVAQSLENMDTLYNYNEEA